MNLSARVKRMEEAHAPGRVRCIVVGSGAEAEAREAEMRAAGEFGPNDTVVFIITGVSRSRIAERPHGRR